MTPMTPDQALDLLNQATAEYQGTRQDHINLQTAVAVLQAAISSGPEAEPAEPVEPEPSSEG